MFVIIYRLADPTTKIETGFPDDFVSSSTYCIHTSPLLFEDQNPVVNNEENRNAIILNIAIKRRRKYKINRKYRK